MWCAHANKQSIIHNVCDGACRVRRYLGSHPTGATGCEALGWVGEVRTQGGSETLCGLENVIWARLVSS